MITCLELERGLVVSGSDSGEILVCECDSNFACTCIRLVLMPLLVRLCDFETSPLISFHSFSNNNLHNYSCNQRRGCFSMAISLTLLPFPLNTGLGHVHWKALAIASWTRRRRLVLAAQCRRLRPCHRQHRSKVCSSSRAFRCSRMVNECGYAERKCKMCKMNFSKKSDAITHFIFI